MCSIYFAFHILRRRLRKGRPPFRGNFLLQVQQRSSNFYFLTTRKSFIPAVTQSPELPDIHNHILVTAKSTYSFSEPQMTGAVEQRLLCTLATQVFAHTDKDSSYKLCHELTIQLSFTNTREPNVFYLIILPSGFYKSLLYFLLFYVHL